MVGDQYPSESDKKLTQQLNIDLALQAAGLGIWEYDPFTRRINWDERCRQLFGLTKDNPMSYEQAFAHIHPDDITRIDQAAQQVMDPQSDGVFDETYRTLGVDDGNLRWVRFQGRVDFTSAGDVHRFAGVAQEVTQQVLARQQIIEAEAQLRTIITHLPSATVVFRSRQLIVETPSQVFIDIIDRGADVAGKPLGELMPELESQSFLRILDQVYTSGQAYRAYGTPVDIRQKDGSITHDFFDLIYTPLFDSQGQVYAILSVATNVTEVMKGHQQVKESKNSLLNAIELARLGTFSMDIATSLVTVSPRTAEWFGFESLSADADSFIAGIGETDRESVRTSLSNTLTPGSDGQFDVSHSVINAKTGHQIIIRSLGQVYFDANGQPLKIEGTAQDITTEREQQQLLEQLVEQRTQELAAINEELAATNEEYLAINEELLATNDDFVAANEALEVMNQELIRSNQNLEQFAYIASHDLQEPLRKIQQFGDLLRSQYAKPDGQELLYLERMQTAASRMSILIKDLLAFSRIATSQVLVTPVSLNKVISQVLDTLSMVIEESKAQIEVDELPTVQGDQLQLTQLFQNLLSNALKFRRTSLGGAFITPQIRIRASRLASDALPTAMKPARSAEAYHLIEVVDNGIGFDEKYVDRIFQVFQRLHGKNEFAGTGVGLAIVQKVVTNHGGAITATSRPGQGAVFYVYLPD